jgi:hypothetical protein
MSIAVQDDAGDRGALVIKERALSRMAARSIAAHSKSELSPLVTVAEIGSESITLSASVTLPYPNEPLGRVLNRLRVEVAADLSQQTGRSVSRLDLRVAHLTVAPERPVRRVL